MGYSYKKAASLLAGDVDLENFHYSLAYQILGSKQVQRANAPNHVMDLIRDADRMIDAEIFGGEKRKLLMDCYNYLCEFAHPNFHSYSLALHVNEQKQIMSIGNSTPLRPEEFGLIGYLEISNSIFVELFDRLMKSIAEIGNNTR